MNTGKRILAVLGASFLGIISNPEMLSASNSVALSGISPDNIVETVVEVEKDPIFTEVAPLTPDTGLAAEISLAPALAATTISTPVALPEPEPDPTPVLTDYVILNGKKFSLNTNECGKYIPYDGASATMCYKRIAAHNWSGFSAIKTLPAGTSIVVAVNGVENTYKISEIPAEKVAKDADWSEIALARGHAYALVTCDETDTESYLRYLD